MSTVDPVIEAVEGTANVSEYLTDLLVGVIGYATTFIAGRWAKSRGGVT